MTPRDYSPRGAVAPCIETLIAQWQQADTLRARDALCDRIVRSTLGLADAVARSFRNRGIDADDLTQVARLGLMKAIQGFDPASGCSFSAYATPTISGEIKRYFRDQGWLVRPPRPLQELRARMSTEEEALRGRLRRDPSLQELADSLGVEREVVSETRLAAHGYSAGSLSTAIEQRPSAEPEAVGDPFGDLVDWESVRPALHSLTDRQREVLGLRYVEDLSQSEIADRVGVSQMQVSPILSRCLVELRDLLRDRQEPVVTYAAGAL